MYKCKLQRISEEENGVSKITFYSLHVCRITISLCQMGYISAKPRMSRMIFTRYYPTILDSIKLIYHNIIFEQFYIYSLFLFKHPFALYLLIEHKTISQRGYLLPEGRRVVLLHRLLRENTRFYPIASSVNYNVIRKRFYSR